MTKQELLQTAKPILFNTEMVRAILNGRKTATRRVVKKADKNWTFESLSNDMHIIGIDRDGCEYPKKVHGLWATFQNKFDEFPVVKSPYCIGDILYVRETWAQTRCADCDIEGIECETNIYRSIPPFLAPHCDDGVYVYRATDSVNSISNGSIKWHPLIHMPRKAARIFLKVTDVQVERLQNITDEQAKAEGANCRNGKDVSFKEKWRRSSIDRFSEIWNSTIKKKDLDIYGWDANPWVWVIEFERLETDE